jgi:8-oxo-dGTP diphosphatase
MNSTSAAGESPRVIVAAVIIIDGRVLACERSAPPEVAGRWEFPGRQGRAGRDRPAGAGPRVREELGVRVEVGARVGPDVPLAHGRAVLRVFAVTLLTATSRAPSNTRRCAGWPPDELDSVPWLPADKPIVAELPPLLADPGPGPA